MSGHTAGPFVIRNDGDKYGDSMVFSEDGRELADFTGGLRDGVTFEEMHANVHLFAAAPDLLEACRRALDFIDDLPVPGTSIVHRFLQDAIAKAESGLKPV